MRGETVRGGIWPREVVLGVDVVRTRQSERNGRALDQIRLEYVH